jgi:hypothetical protein
MRKPSSLAQQVQRARQIFNSWPDSKKANCRLQGDDSFLIRNAEQNQQQGGQPEQGSQQEA